MSLRESNSYASIASVVVGLITLLLIGVAVYFSALSTYYAFIPRHSNRTTGDAKNTTYNKTDSSVNITLQQKLRFRTACFKEPLVIMTMISSAVIVLLICVIVGFVCFAACACSRAKDEPGHDSKHDFELHSWWKSQEGTPQIGYKPRLDARRATYPVAKSSEVRFGDRSFIKPSLNNNNANRCFNSNCYQYTSAPTDDDSSSESSEMSHLAAPPNSSRT